MIARRTLNVLSLASLVFAAGCSDVIQKSANPLSPTIAGPLDGVTFTAPVSVTPAQNAQIKYTDQPVTFAFDSASSSSPRPFTMHLQVASDYPFTKIVFDRAGFEKPENGTRISFRLPDRLPKGVYFWRVRAEDGANNSDWSAPAAFEALEQIIIGRPAAYTPNNNERITTRTPALNAHNGAASGPHKAIQYQFQVSTSSSFNSVVADGTSGMGGGGETIWTVSTNLNYDTTYYWHVRASDGDVTTDWSDSAVFRTPVTPTTPPPSGGGGGGPVTACAGATTGPTIVSCIAARYPERLVAGVSLATRQANMSFLRDRIIEMGRCQGKDWAWNLKRGGPDISIDFITEKINGVVHGHDIGFDYDNTSTPLVIYWGDGEAPFYGGYTNAFTCGG
jgi:hypothetical protein